MIQDLITEYTELTQKLADQQNQLQTAALQHGNDQQEISSLNTQLTGAQARLDDANKKLDDATHTINIDVLIINGLKDDVATAKAQLAQLQSTVTYPDLEYGLWAMNKKPDAASGLGDASFVPADNPKTPALISIIPDPPLAGAKDNYFNVYWTQKKKPNAAVTNYVLKAQFDFPTDTDMRNAHCIEFEGRQVLRLVAPATLPLMSVPALQANFSSGQLRYFNALAPGDNWIPTGIAMPRQRTVAVVMEAHRDDKTLYYDAFTINGQRHAVSFQAPLYAKTYVNERLSVSLQLDSHYLGGPFKVIPSGVSLEVR